MSFFSKYISPKISITVSPDLIEFKRGDYLLRKKTEVYIVGDKIVSIGEKPNPPDSDAQLISLFHNDQLNNHKDRYSALLQFIRFGVLTCLNETSRISFLPFPKPVITYHNLQSLNDILLGYQNFLFYDVTEDVASEVILQGEP